MTETTRGNEVLAVAEKISFDYDSLEEAFPAVEPGIAPFGSRVLVQIRQPKTKVGSILLAEDSKDTDRDITQIAKVLAVGPLAFKNRNTMEQWPEGAWTQPGDYVRCPRYGGDRWTVDGDAKVVVALFNDLDLLGKVTVDPRQMKGWL